MSYIPLSVSISPPLPSSESTPTTFEHSVGAVNPFPLRPIKKVALTFIRHVVKKNAEIASAPAVPINLRRGSPCCVIHVVLRRRRVGCALIAILCSLACVHSDARIGVCNDAKVEYPRVAPTDIFAPSALYKLATVSALSSALVVSEAMSPIFAFVSGSSLQYLNGFFSSLAGKLAVRGSAILGENNAATKGI